MTERSCRYSVQRVDLETESLQREWEEKAIRPSGWEKSCCCDWNSWVVPTTESSSLLPHFNLRWQKSEINRDDLSHRLKRLLNSQRWGRLEDSLTGCLCGGCSWWGDVGELTPFGWYRSAAWAPQDLDLHPHHHTAVRRLQWPGSALNKYPTCTIPFMPPVSPMRSKLWMGKWARESFHSLSKVTALTCKAWNGKEL